MPFLERPGGVRLYYELHGPWEAPSRTPLLLLEGLGGDIPGWRRNIPALSATRPVVAFDFRGNGRSEMPDQPVGISTFVEDTIALLDELRADRADVYGQSFGGMVAQELALTHPARVRSLILAATHAGPSRKIRADRRQSKVPKDRPYLALYSEAFARVHPDHVAEDILVASQHPQAPHAGRRQWEAMQGFDSYDRLPTIGASVLVLQGTDDRLVSVENARMLAERIPGAELVLLEGAGHVYHSEQPEAADGAVLRFLERIDRMEGAA
jgi:3-oxoadipate enol-lactonase